VRLATHRTFKKFVEENGLEFFEIRVDPAELMDLWSKSGPLHRDIVAESCDVGKRQKGIAKKF